MKVLLAEDDADLLDLLTYALRREGYTVLSAMDGQQALKRWEDEAPDIVLLDADPVRDIHNTQKIFKVMKAGQWQSL